ncbi:MAG: hypothetical protein F6K00_07935 [Leptolyngbya sp. SIOISBB]|nr:hypothetical protein [Leptolyngbya sp. SIOISBB]
MPTLDGCFSFSYFRGFVGAPTATVYKDGAIAINGARTIYIGTIANDWKGQKEELRDYIAATEDGILEQGGTNSYVLRIVAVRKSGSSVATLITFLTVGSIVAAGAQLSLVVSNVDGNPAGFTIELEQV